MQMRHSLSIELDAIELPVLVVPLVQSEEAEEWRPEEWRPEDFEEARDITLNALRERIEPALVSSTPERSDVDLTSDAS